MKLTAVAISKASIKDKPYTISDGRGLQLLIHPNGSKYWRLRYRINGKQPTFAVGVYCGPSEYDSKGLLKKDRIITGLAEARDIALEALKLIASGIDPNQAKKQARLQPFVDESNTFEAVAREWHRKSAAKWSTDHAARILRRMVLGLFPQIGKTAIDALKTKDLLLALQSVEERGHLDVASRLRQYITAIMRYAVQTDRIDTNPAVDLQGALTVVKSTHHPALPLERLPELLKRIDAFEGRGLTKAALQLTLLTFVRSSEIRFMRWNEIDWERAIWTIPAQREAIEGVKHSQRGAKMKTPHIVPLASQALAVLERIKPLTGGFSLVFAGDHDPNKPMSENTVNKALRTMGYDTVKEVCGHGFRTLACSALNESGKWERDVIERQMSHQERNGVRAAYIHKAEYLARRQQMMQWWADYLDALRSGKYIEPVEHE